MHPGILQRAADKSAGSWQETACISILTCNLEAFTIALLCPLPATLLLELQPLIGRGHTPLAAEFRISRIVTGLKPYEAVILTKRSIVVVLIQASGRGIAPLVVVPDKLGFSNGLAPCEIRPGIIGTDSIDITVTPFN